MRVLPETEDAEREINQRRHKRDEQPLARGRVPSPERSSERVEQHTRRESKVNPGTTRADGERMAFEIKRALGNLVAHVVEHFIKHKRRRVVPMCERHRRDDNQAHEKKRQRCRR